MYICAITKTMKYTVLRITKNRNTRMIEELLKTNSKSLAEEIKSQKQTDKNQVKIIES